MNIIDMNELNEMREQLATLKKRLESQEIVNDRLIKEAMSRKLSAINRRALWLCLICLVAIPYTFFAFGNLGMSSPFCYATVALLAVSLAAMIWNHYRLGRYDVKSGKMVAFCLVRRDTMVGDLGTVYKEVARLRKIYKSWHFFSIPILILWLLWGAYDVYTYVTQDTTLLLSIASGALFGGIIGGIFGMRMHNQTLRSAEDILRQIEELQRES